MTLRHIIHPAAAAVIALALLCSCGSSRKNVSPGQYEPSAGQTTDVDPKAGLSELAESYTGWTSLSMPVRLNLTEPKNFSISGTMKMRYGESILISARMLGFEVASIYADTDSVQICVKALDVNCYFSESIAELTERYGFSLADLQSLLLGQVFIPGKGTMDKGDVRLFKPGAKENGEFTFSPDKMPAGLNWIYTASCPENGSPSLSAMTIETAQGNTIDCIFGNTVASPAGPVAGSIAVATSVKNRNISLMLSGTTDRARWNEDESISKPKISKKARRVGSEEIYKMLRKF